MINYCVQGEELFQKLYRGLAYMVPKHMGKSSETETEMYFSNQTHIQGSCLNYTS